MWNNDVKYYTGIGSRTTPVEIQKLMEITARKMRAERWILRSGGAHGADSAFERGAKEQADIYLPWAGFNGHQSDLYRVGKEAMEIVDKVSPRPMKDSVQRLFGRSVYQVLGGALNSPSQGVIYWAPETPTGIVQGGTRIAVYVARMYGIPTLNLYFDQDKQALMYELGITEKDIKELNYGN